MFVTLKYNAMLQFIEVNEKYEISTLPTQIVDDSPEPLMEFQPSDTIALYKNSIFIGQENRVLVGKLLVS
jgi:hypothetical protein